MTNPITLWAPHAWLPTEPCGSGAWQDNVLLQIAANGTWDQITSGAPCPPRAQRLTAPVIPSLVNAHSHAFQRAFVGLTERSHGSHDDFWSWRDRMYGEALTITPQRMLEVATKLYSELLRGGYTQVCEFHYLHHDVHGKPYAPAATMAMALVEAARVTGLGLTLLPVVYERAGFDAPALREDQRRFAANAAMALSIRDDIRRMGVDHVNAGIALHSLRAVPPSSVEAIQALTANDAAAIHIHVAEQTAEVDACVAATGLRPLAWLTEHAKLDARWQLVHATHATPEEILAVASTHAGVVLCPTTEANLGDGLCDLQGWLDAEVPIAIGSDSHVTRSWPEELRWLEYGQRLLHRRRNVAAHPAQGHNSSAARLFDRAVRGGCSAAGFSSWGLRVGARADLLVLNPDDSALQHVDSEHLLDAVVFASPALPFKSVMVAGRWV